MRGTAGWITLATAAAVLAACHRAAPSVAPVSDPVGLYTFEEDLTAPSGLGGHTIAGELRILPDSFTVDSRYGACRRPANDPQGLAVVNFTCPDFSLAINRRDPLGKTMYTVTTVETVHRTECTRYEVDENGRKICVERGDKIEEKNVPRSGRVHLHATRG